MNLHKRKRFHSRSATVVLVISSFLISFVVALLVLELLIHLQYPIATLYRYSPSSDYLMEPNRVVIFEKHEFRTEIRTNSYGLRDDEPKRLSDVRILLLGDSFVFGHGVEHQETFGYLLEGALGASLQKEVEIINAGHNGYDTRRELAFFKEYGDLFKPTMVMIGFTLNDVLSNSGEYFFSPISLGIFRDFPLRSVQSLAEYLKTPSKLFRKLGILEEITDDEEIDYFDCLRAKTECRAGWDSTSSYFAELEKLARQRNLPVVLVNIPVLDQIEADPDKEPYDRRFASLQLQRLSTSLGFHFVDLAACEDLSKISYFEQDGHWNASGHAAATECIDEQFQKEWLSRVNSKESINVAEPPPAG